MGKEKYISKHSRYYFFWNKFEHHLDLFDLDIFYGFTTQIDGEGNVKTIGNGWLLRLAGYPQSNLVVE